MSRQTIDETGRDTRLARSDERISAFLRRRVPEASYAVEADMRLFIERNRAIAAPYRIRSEQGLARFCLLQWAMQGEALLCRTFTPF